MIATLSCVIFNSIECPLTLTFILDAVSKRVSSSEWHIMHIIHTTGHYIQGLNGNQSRDNLERLPNPLYTKGVVFKITLLTACQSSPDVIF